MCQQYPILPHSTLHKMLFSAYKPDFKSQQPVLLAVDCLCINHRKTIAEKC
uniref:Uncharacterized protein n=1 Tax=Ciona intestinalis TaxID=7719 RepID=F6VRI0_CIOIN